MASLASTGDGLAGMYRSRSRRRGERKEGEVKRNNYEQPGIWEEEHKHDGQVREKLEGEKRKGAGESVTGRLG